MNKVLPVIVWLTGTTGSRTISKCLKGIRATIIIAECRWCDTDAKVLWILIVVRLRWRLQWKSDNCHTVLSKNKKIHSFLLNQWKCDNRKLVDTADSDQNFLQTEIMAYVTQLHNTQTKRPFSTWRWPSSPKATKLRQESLKGITLLGVYRLAGHRAPRICSWSLLQSTTKCRRKCSSRAPSSGI
jgi:hypothetical protein